MGAGLVLVWAAFWAWGGPLCGFDSPCRPDLPGAAFFLAGLAALLAGLRFVVRSALGRAATSGIVLIAFAVPARALYFGSSWLTALLAVAAVAVPAAELLALSGRRARSPS